MKLPKITIFSTSLYHCIFLIVKKSIVLTHVFILSFLSFQECLLASIAVDSLTYAFNSSQDYPTKITSALAIASYFKQQTPDSSLYWAERAYQLAVQQEDKQWQIRTLIPLSDYEFRNDLWHESVETAQLADRLLNIYPNDTLKLSLLYRLAEGYEYTSRLVEGMKTYEACYQLAEQMNNKVMLGRLDLKMGFLNQVLNENEEAIEFFKKSIDHLSIDQPEAFEYFHRAYISHANLILDDTSLVNIEERNTVCSSLMPMYEAIPEDKDFLDGKVSYKDLYIRCLLLTGTDEDIQSLPLLSISDLSKQTPYENRLRDRLDIFGALALRQGKLNRAKTYIDRSWAIADKSENIVMKIYSLNMKKAYYKATHNYNDMVKVMEAVIPYDEELKIKEKMKSLNHLENLLAAKEKQHEIDLLNKDKEFLVLQNRNYTISLGIFALFTSLIGFLFYRTRVQNRVIAQQNSELVQLNNTKDRLFAIIGHDLRKPALAFRGISKKVNFLIQKKEFNTLDKLGKNLEQAAFSLNSLLDNLLNWALKQRDALPYDPKPVNVQEATEEIFQLFEQIAEEKGIHLRLNIPSSIYAYTDPNAINTIIRNLVDNAIKYTIKGGFVEVYSEQQKENVLIQIKDTGEGMTQAQMKTLFELDRNKSTQGTKGEKGSGLGLALVKDLVDLNKGEIIVTSELKAGTTFKILLPAVA